MDQPAVALFVVFGKITSVGGDLIDETTVESRGGLKLEHYDRAPSEQNDIGPPAAL
jgi:hypothetical protein